MSTSGPLLPTVSQGDSGASPLDSTQTLSSQERVSLLTTSSVITHNSPSKFSTKERNDEEEKTVNSQTSLQRPQSLPVEDTYNPGYSYTNQRDPHLTQIDPSPGRKNECLRPTPSGDDKANISRDWNVTYSEMFQDEGGGDGPAFVESDDDAGSTPPAVRWAKSLRNLLEDEVGANIFRTFLLQELRTSNVLDFWYACKGLRENESGFESISDVIQVIWKKFIRKQTVKVSRATFKLIEARIDREPSNPTIFDEAQYEVEKEMSETLYRAFLESDLYLSYLLPVKKEVGVDSSPTSPIPFDTCCSSSVPCSSSYLPTVHEDSEFDVRGSRPPRLTSNILLATASHRAQFDRIKPELNAGCYLNGSLSQNPNPYHVAYISGHSVSLQDSERQSLSSGAHTDDTKSCTDSSLDGNSLSSLSQHLNRKHQRRHAIKIKENAMQNKETRLISSISGGVHVLPRTMLYNQSNAPRASSNPEEFMKILTEKLEKYQFEKDRKEVLTQSITKVAHSEGAPEEIRREHAVNALPPNVLLNKLCEKVQLDDQDPSQSILDEHVARVWDSPRYSPGSPKQVLVDALNKSCRGNVTKQLPHLNYPNQNVSKAMKHHINVPITSSSPSSLYPNVTQSSLGARGRHPSFQGVEGYGGGHLASGYQPRNMHHGRRKERGQDVYSTFSSDSGNVADYHDCVERIPPSCLPKSKSMPEYIENQTSGTSDASHRRYCGSGTRRCCRRTPADFTDSGVSVVSDSGRSGAPSSSSERVESWLFQNCSSNINPSYSVCPGGEREFSKEFHKVKGSRSTHTMAGSTSPGTQGKWVANSGRRSQSSSSTSANTCINVRADVIPSMSSGQLSRPYEMSRDSPLGQAQPMILSEKKKIKGGSSSGKSTGHSSSFEGSGSNGSTLKDPKPSKQCGEIIAPPSGAPATGVSSPSADVTTIVYSFQDDHVPFIIKVPSRPVTLKKFKQHLHKKGSFRYFFKKYCEDMGMVYEEITDDAEILPLFDGKVFVQIHKDD